ncbi:MAG: aminofutalosine synthase MqnE [Planctomycetia bacterium]|nr:aminofutalosine synthase MqnE [Planctomycetia bacterium]
MERYSRESAIHFFDPEKWNLHALGQLADARRREVSGDAVFYNVNLHINLTNVCKYRCGLCAFSCDAHQSRAYRLSVEEVLKKVEQASREKCTEVHIVSGVDPSISWKWYVDVVRQVHVAFPKLKIKAFTAVEIAWMAEESGQDVTEILEELKSVGLETIPGGGAEILVDSVREKICAKKPMSEVWLDVHRKAHQLGIPSTATILYGHVERMCDRVDHLLKLRDLQDETGGFMAFVPLAFHPKNTALADRVKESPSAEEDLRMVAAARLILDNIPHIKAYWISLGVRTAQVALAYGADDLDGTVRQEKIHHDAGSDTPEFLSVEEIRRLIKEAGRRPVQRNSVYRSLES